MSKHEDNLPPLKLLYGTGEPQPFRVVFPLYGGDFLTEDCSIRLPFVLRKELIEPTPGGGYRVVESAPERVKPACPHFKVCGGCQYQMTASPEQLNVKRRILQSLLAELGIEKDHYIEAHAAEPYGYRNRIRLRIQRTAGELRFGYNIRATTDFLPITTCPISAPNLIPIVEALLALPSSSTPEGREAEYWLSATAEVELFTNDDLSRVQLTLFVAPRTKPSQGSFTRMMNTLQQRCPQVVGAAAAAFDPRTGPTGRILADHGAAGLNYKVGDETYWVSRGGFFQVNRFLISKLVDLVTNGRSGEIAWDLFAGVGLFSRVLAKSFAQVTAVEANPAAAADLRGALSRLGPQHRAIQETTSDFLHAAVIQRERPELIVLDPPRAGAGLEACALLGRIAAPRIVYVSCDPTTLARDLGALQTEGYRISEIHLVDLFPQTFHIETVVTLFRET